MWKRERGGRSFLLNGLKSKRREWALIREQWQGHLVSPPSSYPGLSPLTTHSSALAFSHSDAHMCTHTIPQTVHLNVLQQMYTLALCHACTHSQTHTHTETHRRRAEENGGGDEGKDEIKREGVLGSQGLSCCSVAACTSQ